MVNYLFLHPDTLIEDGEGDSSTKLFTGDLQYEIFINIFQKFIDENIETFRLLGVDKFFLGTHSDRKCAIALVSNGCTVSPSYGINFSLYILENGTSQGLVYLLWKFRQPISSTKCNWGFITRKIVYSIYMLLWIPKRPSWQKKYRERDSRKYGEK